MRLARRVCLAALALGLAAGPAAANDDAANNGPYLELQGGASFWNDIGSGNVNFDTGFTVGGAVGFRLVQMLRLEAHVSYRRADIDSVEIGDTSVDVSDAYAGATAFLANAYFDIPIPFPIKPYVGAGAGAAVFSADVDVDDVGVNVEVDDDDTHFAWNVMAGVFVPLFRHLELDARYRYIDSVNPDLDFDFDLVGEIEDIDLELEAHEVVGIVRVVF